MKNQEPKKKKSIFSLLFYRWDFWIVFFYGFFFFWNTVHLVGNIAHDLRVFSSFLFSASHFMFVNLSDYCFNWTLDSMMIIVCAKQATNDQQTNELGIGPMALV